MQAFDYYQKYQRQLLGSTEATQPITETSKRLATGSVAIDWHADRKTEQE